MKRQIIIGTAGHIDHGKTALIRALTGRETDRLKEEKQRGISIDLGFTHYDLSTGERIGFIDVPGHERFVANMLTGAFGMDFVLFIVAADEGMMPQSREHLEILELLKVESGIVVITKIDMVEPEWLEMVTESLDEELAGSFLTDAPRICVSSKTGAGIEGLKAAIENLAAKATRRDEGGLARLWVDRSFSIKGFGSVVTGTLLGGSLETGEEVMAYPQEETSKIRRIQVHDRNVERAVAGQRVAINLPSFSKDRIGRGDLISLPNRMTMRDRIGVWVQAAKESPRPLHRGMELRLHLGSRKVPCKIEYMEPDAVTAGQEGWMILRLEEAVPLVPFDRFVLRNLSPVETLAGGQVLELDPPRGRRARRDLKAKFAPIYQGGTKDALLLRLNRPTDEVQTVSGLSRIFGRSEQEIDLWLRELETEGEVFRISGCVFSRVERIRIFQRLLDKVNTFHREFPLLRGLPKKQGLDCLFPKGTVKQQLVFLTEWEAEGHGASDEACIWASGFSRKMTETQNRIYMELLDRAANRREAAKESGWLDGLPNADAIWRLMIEEGIFLRLDGELYAARDFVEAGMRYIAKNFKEKGFTVAEFRDAYGVSRKQALLLLEAYDRENWTKREGDQRIVRELPKFIG